MVLRSDRSPSQRAVHLSPPVQDPEGVAADHRGVSSPATTPATRRPERDRAIPAEFGSHSWLRIDDLAGGRYLDETLAKAHVFGH